MEKILNYKPFEDKDAVFSIKENMFISIYEQVVKEGFKMAVVLPVASCDIQMHLSESYEDSFDLEHSLPLSGIYWDYDQSHGPLVKNYFSVMDIATDEVNLAVLTQKYYIYISKEASAGSVQYPSEIESVFKKTSLAYARGQEEVKTSVLEDDALHCKSTKVVNLILYRNVLTNLLEGGKVATWGSCNWPTNNTHRPCEQRQKIDYRFRHRDASVKNQAERWLYKETAQQIALASHTIYHERSSTKNISQRNNCVLQLCLQDNSFTMQCVPKLLATTNIISETADGMKETPSFCIGKWVNETDKGTTFMLQDSSYNPPSAKINSRRKPKRFYRLAPSFQISRNIPMNSKENRNQELFISEMKPMNCMSATNVFQSEMASIKLSVQETVGTCYDKLDQIADEGSQFCETFPLSKIANNKVKKEGRKKDNLLPQGLDSGTVQSWHTLKHKTIHNELLPDPSNKTDVYSINSSMTILNKSKTFFTVKPVLICLPYANISRPSEALFSNINRIKKEGNLSQFEQYGASSCNPCVRCELAEISRSDDDQELLMCLEKCPFLELQLSLEFALQLVELFGPPGIDPDFLCTEDCKVRLDKQVTKMIHSQWKKSVEERLKRISSMDPNTFKGGMTLYNTEDINGEIHQEPNHETEEKSSAALDSHPNRSQSGEDDARLLIA
ncbi:uncharacterized protein LOC144682716 [Cetorhinus maximus]